MKPILILFLLMSVAQAQTTGFENQVKSGIVNCSTTGNDSSVHYALPLMLKLASTCKEAIQVTIPAGFVFKALDSTFQNIVVTQRIVATLSPGQSKQIALHGMCIESGDRAPKGTCSYTPDKMAPEKIVKLAQFIEQNKFFSPAGQEAMWALIDDAPLYEVTSLDTSQAAILQKFLSELTGKPITKAPEEEAYLFDYSEKPHKVIVGGEINFSLHHRTSVVWALFSEDGILLREMYNGFVEPGESKLTFEYDAEVFDNPVYYLKLVADDKVVYNKKMSFNH